MTAFAYINADCQIPVTNLVLAPLENGWELANPLSWSAFITYATGSRNDQSQVFAGQSDVWTPIAIDFQGLCVGGTIHMQVTASWRDTVSGAVIPKNWDGTNYVLGQSPPIPAIKARLGSIPLQVIAYKESRVQAIRAGWLSLCVG